MAFKHQFKSKIDPKIPLVEMSIWDDSPESAFDDPGGKGNRVIRPDSSKSTNKRSIGKNQPFVIIGGIHVPPSDFIEMTITEDGFVPKVKFIFYNSSGGFRSYDMPRKNPIISVYLKSPNDRVKPIRNDYLITNIRDLGDDEWMIDGELFIPKLYKNVSKSFPNMTSKKALLNVCKDLGLGFQSNDFKADDKMTWINPNWDYLTFIRYVLDRSYSGENSFFDGWIDRFYHFNMVEINSQLEHQGKADRTLMAMYDTKVTKSMENLSSGIQEETIAPNMLLYYPGYNSGPGVIKSYEVISDNGEILINNGYRKRIFYYDHDINEVSPSKKMKNFYARPNLSDKLPKGVTDLEPNDEDLKNGEIRTWMGVNYDNAHSNFPAAKLYNSHNSIELDKFTLKVKAEGVNFNILRGQRVPVMIFMPNTTDQLKNRSQATNQSVENEPTGSGRGDLKKDGYLSGFYYVKGLKITFTKKDGSKNEIITEIELSKREWKDITPRENENSSDVLNNI